MSQNLLEIFRAGRHTALSGAVLEFSNADLLASARAYDPAKHEAPIVVGHPRIDAPAYGWVNSLSAQRGLLYAEAKQVEPAFAELVNAGRFKKISAAFFPPHADSNPVPGVYYLRHVGFLGATPPAVKGLRTAEFAGADSDLVTIEFGAWSEGLIADLFRGLREWIIGKFGQEEADQVLPNYAVDDLIREAMRPREPMPEPVEPAGFAESQHEGNSMSDDLKAQQAALAEQAAAFAQRESALAAREQKLLEQEAAARRRELAEFCDGLIKQGKLLPRDKAGAVEFMAALDEQSMIEFGEGADQQRTATLNWFQRFLQELPKAIEFGEVAGAEQTPANPAQAAEKKLFDQVAGASK